MSERRRRRGKGRRQGKEFMDAALDAYRRHLALQKWRDVTDLQDTLDLDTPQASRHAGRFPERGPYRDIWERWWAAEVVARDVSPETSLFGRIEAAVQGALQEEIAARRQHDDAPLEDSLAYKTFIDQALDRLFEEEAGSLEE